MSIADAPSLVTWQRTQADLEQDLAFRDAKWRQVHFVRRELTSALMLPASEEHDAAVHVISTHYSKSTLLPVYRLTREGLEVILRGNYYNWSVTVRSEEPVLRQSLVPLVLGGGEQAVLDCYCEGFDEAWVHGPMAADARTFTVQLPYMYGPLWAFVYGLTEHLR